jgi:UDP-glucose 4-epimerase
MISGSGELRIGSLEPKRDFTYVTDTVSGFLAAGDSPGIEGEMIQLGTGSTNSIGEIVELARRLTGFDADVITEAERVRPERSEVMVLLSDPARARELLGWTPVVSLEDGLSRTAKWIEANLELFDPSRFHV